MKEELLKPSTEINHLKSEANNGNAAQYLLGRCYFLGEGVPKDHSKAVEYFQRAADQGYALARNDLGFVYHYGYGVPQDYAQAVKYYQLAADQGNAFGQNNLGTCYYRGEGVEQDYAQAAQYFQRAADQGNADAQYALGLFFLKTNLSDAVNFFKLAADQGYKSLAKKIIALVNEGNAEPSLGRVFL